LSSSKKSKKAPVSAPGFATRAVHAGEWKEVPAGRPTSTPIYSTPTFTYDSMAEMDRVFGGEAQGFVYTRHGNPTVAAVERAVAALEEGTAAVAYGSGMAALHAALLACELRPGAVVLASQDLYGATLDLLVRVFDIFGVQTVTADFSDVAAVAKQARAHKPRVLIAETISNPLLKICDLAACAEVAHEAGARFIVDNTFASPYLCQPLRHGADFVVHSLTKYLAGHASVTGGVVIVRDQPDQTALIGVMKLVGGILGPFEAHEVLRGMKTLPLRMERQCANARAIAEKLSRDPRVKQIYYPSLNESKKKLERILRPPHGGALLSVVPKNDSREGAFRFMDALRVCVRATSLGDVFSTALHPATASHREMPPSRRKKLGISDGLVRISAGIEDVEDLLADIDGALTAASAGV
jgi:cystathionine beta-lyase/cystathionine gamma-synthase